MVTPAELAYCAGIIDADGCIAISRSKSVKHRNFNYYETVTVAQVQPRACQLLHKLFGGMLTISPAKTKQANPTYVWRISAKKAVPCITEIVPYLRLKRLSAVTCLRLRQVKTANPNPRRAGQSQAVLREMDILYQLSRRFNVKGSVGKAVTLAIDAAAYSGKVGN